MSKKQNGDLWIVGLFSLNFFKCLKGRLRFEWIPGEYFDSLIRTLVDEAKSVHVFIPYGMREYLNSIFPDLKRFPKVRSVEPVKGDTVVFLSRATPMFPTCFLVHVEELEEVAEY